MLQDCRRNDGQMPDEAMMFRNMKSKVDLNPVL